MGSIVMNVTDARRASEFWSRALGYRRSPTDPSYLVPEHGEGTRLYLDEDDRTHLDLHVASAEEAAAEVDRLVSLGARRVEDWTYPEHANFVVLTDTEGNVFCVVHPSGEGA
jgi:hypothetical protein